MTVSSIAGEAGLLTAQGLHLMNRTAKITIALFAVALLGSIGLNAFLYQLGQDYYLQLNTTRLDPLGLSAYEGLENQPQRPVIVFYGDSRAADWPAPDGIKDATIINRGIDAQTTVQVLGRFQKHIAPLKPQVIVLQVGINDLKAIPLFPGRKAAIIQACKDNIRQLVDLSLDSGARVVLTTIFPLGTVSVERRLLWSDDVAVAINDVNAFIGTLAGNRVAVFDAVKVLANSKGRVDPRYSRDLLHLNSEGYAALNQAISGSLAP